jgi:inorganic pyrophosphatase
MALLDEEETDWKVIVIDEKDPLAPKLNGMHTCSQAAHGRTDNL